MTNPILLAVQYRNQHILACRLLHPTVSTLEHLKRWHPTCQHATWLIEIGTLHSLRQGRSVVSLYRDHGEPSEDHQPYTCRSLNALKALARQLKISTIYLHHHRQWQEHSLLTDGSQRKNDNCPL